MSRDPIEEEGGENLYAMVDNDAVNQYDILGLMSECCMRLKKAMETLQASIRTDISSSQQLSQAINDMTNAYAIASLADFVVSAVGVTRAVQGTGSAIRSAKATYMTGKSSVSVLGTVTKNASGFKGSFSTGYTVVKTSSVANIVAKDAGVREGVAQALSYVLTEVGRKSTGALESDAFLGNKSMGSLYWDSLSSQGKGTLNDLIKEMEKIDEHLTKELRYIKMIEDRYRKCCKD
jgi:hypothetical protein